MGRIIGCRLGLPGRRQVLHAVNSGAMDQIARVYAIAAHGIDPEIAPCHHARLNGKADFLPPVKRQHQATQAKCKEPALAKRRNSRPDNDNDTDWLHESRRFVVQRATSQRCCHQSYKSNRRSRSTAVRTFEKLLAALEYGSGNKQQC